MLPMIASNGQSPFDRFAAQVVQRHDEHLLDEGPEEQAPRVAKRLALFAKTTPLIPVINTVIDLAGFGEASAHFESADAAYLLLSEIADALGWPLNKAVAWAELQYGYAVQDQRRTDEERGDGRLGYEHMRDYIDLGIYAIVDDPEAKPDAGGRKWSHSGDWLISNGRLPWLLSCSPWGKEFVDNTIDAWSHGMRKVFGDKLRNVPTVNLDGTPTGGNAYDDMFLTDLSEEEALRKARRGPVLDNQGGAA